jgi:DNA mismatch endonuclease (patch repair protein)
MTDVVDAATRSRMMASIRSRDTQPERAVRRALHARGCRFRLHSRTLPGRPDIVLPRYRAVVLVHGCFWHGHRCQLFRLPGTRREFWREKIRRNRARDRRVLKSLAAAGWRAVTVWECALGKGDPRTVADLAGRIVDWLESGGPSTEIAGSPAG